MSETCFSQISLQRYVLFYKYANNFVAKDSTFVSMQQNCIYFATFVLCSVCFTPVHIHNKMHSSGRFLCFYLVLSLLNVFTRQSCGVWG